MSDSELEALLDALARVEPRECVLGGRGLRLFEPEDLPDAQLGFSVGASGQDLTGAASGDWRAGWYVVGEDDEHGDPLFVDRGAAGFPVFTAMTGEGAWESLPVAPSLAALGAVFSVWSELGSGRGTVEGLEARPLAAEECEAAVRALREIAPGQDLRFWQDWLEACRG